MEGIIQKLKNMTFPVAMASKDVRYFLQQPLILLDLEKIKKSIQANSIHIDLFEKVASTNEYLKRATSPQPVNICLAEMQTQGKGRFQHSWHSPFGQNIYLSLKYPFNTLNKDVSKFASLSLVCGLAICKAIEENCQLIQPLFVKWPNDIICEDKKLAGILIEIEAEKAGVCSTIIGIGLNVNMENDEDKITQRWISLKNLTTIYQDRNQLCAALINHLIDCISTFEKQCLNNFLEVWKERDYLLNKPIRLKSGHHILQGKSLGINEQGHLVINLPDGSQRTFSSGDATLL